MITITDQLITIKDCEVHSVDGIAIKINSEIPVNIENTTILGELYETTNV